MKRRLILAFALLGSLAFAQEEKKEAEPAKPAAAAERVKFSTSKGDIVIELDRAKAPVTVENFLSYVKKKHYDGTVFHRVIGTFMIQGGGFAQKDGSLIEKETGKGIKNEASNGLKNDRGTIAMARTGDPNSATAQFFINVVDNAMLNAPSPDGHGYAVFGKVVEGLEVVDQIKAVQTGTKKVTARGPGGATQEAPFSDVPTEDVVIKTATVVEAK
ncbi:peptidylprolyl isomerase [Luteolibacter sp. GHJ8]|jgi:peptidyl-prolyl cis-trans isomerase A (cyclophilin A)|uniref:Peptidyl-prolyl cis-trans isomerase n=1 Tax=Luteolibacter rhizosphaerae TaxID=2989719 RepID=A0ABT3G883_9BACT|nr:peptidylprolyl isomerase [Luteolibacter rhizosphaerae]MCW1916053.1 peptidylprolyl isomerase [Luteolibacter rhizosphaerae]